MLEPRQTQLTESDFFIRPALPNELLRLQVIETAADQLYRQTPFAFIADFDPLAIDTLFELQQAQQLLVAQSRTTNQAAGFAALGELEQLPFLLQLSVHPANSRHGIGTALVKAACDWACARHYSRLLLSTFRQIPWNRPFYERCGFRTLADDTLELGLQQARQDEIAYGLPVAERVFMQFDL